MQDVSLKIEDMVKHGSITPYKLQIQISNSSALKKVPWPFLLTWVPAMYTDSLPSSFLSSVPLNSSSFLTLSK